MNRLLVENPLYRARRILGDRVVPVPDGMYRLDGRLVTPRQLVCTANDVLEASGLPVIAYPGTAHA